MFTLHTVCYYKMDKANFIPVISLLPKGCKEAMKSILFTVHSCSP